VDRCVKNWAVDTELVGLITTAIAGHKTCENSGSQALETPADQNKPLGVPESGDSRTGLVTGHSSQTIFTILLQLTEIHSGPS